MWQWLKRLYHRLGSPKWFYEISARWIPWLVVLSAVGAVTGIVWGLAYAPADYLQGNSFRIIYIHVPAAILAQSAYMMMAVAGAIYLIWRMKMAAWVAKCIAPIGASFCLIALLTGAIWGKPTWGTWWVWDARLTSMLVLFFLYLGYMALNSAFDDPQRGTKASAILAMVGFVNVPIIKFSVDWWNTLHQPASILRMDGPTIHPDMLWPLFLMIGAATAYYLWVLMLRMRRELTEGRVRARRQIQAEEAGA